MLVEVGLEGSKVTINLDNVTHIIDSEAEGVCFVSFVYKSSLRFDMTREDLLVQINSEMARNSYKY